jgi:3-methyladenine DNA glycosylase AlkD
MLNDLKKDIQKLANPKKAKLLQGFFKTAKGQYGEGDIFLGLTVPIQRQIVKKYINLSLPDTTKLLHSKIHEYRLISLLILVKKYEKGNDTEKKKIYNLYLKNTKWINNWDLVDLSAPRIVGDYLLDKDRKILYTLIKSKNLWDRRIAVLATATFIWHNDFSDIIRISKLLLKDSHDLIHKATGWMLREVGKRDQKLLEKFLEANTTKMPRTMLRYSIEKFPESKRKYYLNK